MAKKATAPKKAKKTAKKVKCNAKGSVPSAKSETPILDEKKANVPVPDAATEKSDLVNTNAATVPEETVQDASTIQEENGSNDQPTHFWLTPANLKNRSDEELLKAFISGDMLFKETQLEVKFLIRILKYFISTRA